MIGKVEYIHNGTAVTTKGLIQDNLYELYIGGDGKQTDKELLLRYIVNYIVYSRAIIKPGQTMSYGSWLLKFEKSVDATQLEIWERAPGEESEFFRFGALFTLELWNEQSELCRNKLARHDPPSPDMLVAVSKGVYEGLPVDGVRYAVSNNMSGWFITTEQYDGNIESLQVVHIGHLVSKRRSLAKYLGLPPGYRFGTYDNVKDSIRFDTAVANQPV